MIKPFAQCAAEQHARRTTTTRGDSVTRDPFTVTPKHECETDDPAAGVGTPQRLPAPPSPVQEPRIRVPRSALPTLAVGVGCRTPPSPLGVAQTRCWRQAGRRWQVDPALPSRLLTAGHASRVSLALPSNGWRLAAGRASQVDPALPSRLLMAGHASRVSLALPSNGWRLAAGRASQVDPALPSRLLMAGQASQVVLALPSNGWRLARRRRSTQPSPVSLP